MYWLSSFCPGLVPFINRTYYKFVYGVPGERVDRGDKVMFVYVCLDCILVDINLFCVLAVIL